MFKKKKGEDEWIIGDEDFFKEELTQELKASKKKNRKKDRGKYKEEDYCSSECDEYSYYDEKQGEKPVTRKHRPNPLRKRDNDEYTYDSFDDYIVEMEERKPVAKWKIILPTFILAFVFIAGIGYFNTDFDNNGQAYIIPLEIHYERKYIKEADELLELMLEINQSIDTDTQQLPYDYINLSSKLIDEMAQLKSMTTTFSKYVGVPRKFDTYHSQLINFSLSTQKLVDKLVKNYNDVNYESFRESALEDYYNSFSRLKYARTDIDNVIFRNMGGNE